MSTDLVHDSGAQIDHQAILRHLKLDVSRPETQAVLVVCDRYGLDPLLKHVVLINGSMYVTRDGYLAVAHRSGQFDGIEVLETGADDTHYTAKVSVWRKDMGRPFTYIGRYPKNGGNKAFGPEMAVKTAEAMALRRAFNVTGVGAADERWDETAAPAPAPSAPQPQAIVAQSTTRRRPPPAVAAQSPDDMLTAGDAKWELVAALMDEGESEDTAKVSAKKAWADNGWGSEPHTRDEVGALIAWLRVTHKTPAADVETGEIIDEPPFDLDPVSA